MTWKPVGTATLAPTSSDTPAYSPTLAVTCDGQLISCPSTDGWIRFYDRGKMTPVFALHGLGNQSTTAPRGIYHISCAKTVPYLCFTQTPNDPIARGWDLRTQKVEIQLNHGRPISTLDLGCNDIALVAGVQDNVAMWYLFLLYQSNSLLVSF